MNAATNTGVPAPNVERAVFPSMTIENVDDFPVRSNPFPQMENDATSDDTAFVFPTTAIVAPNLAFVGGGAERCPSTT